MARTNTPDDPTKLKLALASARNSAHLLAASKSLHVDGLYGPSQALAITGQEEAGKWLYYLMLLLGCPDFDRLHRRVHSKHIPKQALGLLLIFLSEVQERDLYQVATRLYEGLTSNDSDGEALRDLLGLLAREPGAIEEHVAFIGKGGLQRQKHAGLYVGVGKQWRVESPCDVTSESALEQVRQLEAASGMAMSFAEAVFDEDLAVRQMRAWREHPRWAAAMAALVPDEDKPPGCLR
jgi:AbiV family abortive infection protein